MACMQGQTNPKAQLLSTVKKKKNISMGSDYQRLELNEKETERNS